MKSETEVLVIGAGPAGSAIASALHREGHEVTIVDRAIFPRFVIGESLLPACLDALKATGLYEAVCDRGYQRKVGAAFIRGDASTRFLFTEQHTEGHDHAWQMPRADFDLALAQAVGVPVHHGYDVVDGGVGDAPRITVAAPDGERTEVAARFVVDASGYGRVLPRALGLNRPSALPSRTALYTHISGCLEEEPVTTVAVHPEGPWVWRIPFVDGTTSVGVVWDDAWFDALPGDDDAKLRAALRGEPSCAGLADGEFLFEPRRHAGYSVGVSQVYGPGFCLVGNTTEFLDPVFSSGVTLALASAERAAGCVSRTLRGEPVDWQRDYAAWLGAGVEVFRTYVDAWYDGRLADIFLAAAPEPRIRRQICSVLAGYVWDETNPFVREPARKLDQLSRMIV